MYTGRLIFGYLFYIALSVFCSIVFGGDILTRFWTSLLIYCALSYIIVRLWKFWRKKEALNFFHFFIVFLYKSSLLLSIFFFLFGSFLYVQNELFPAKLPLYTLSNGEKTLKFQTMSHIASQNFYTQVHNTILLEKKQGFVLFYEGVREGTPENQKDFDTALGVQFDRTLYENFSKLYGVVAQDNALFLGLENTKDYNIDISLDEVMKLYRAKNPIQEKSLLSKHPEVQDINIQVIKTLSGLSEKQIGVLQYINQSLLNFIIKHEGLRNTIIEKVGNPDIFSVILDERNEYLAQEILDSSEKNIFVIYGLMHFAGVYELLQKADSRWKIVDIQESQIITRS